MSAVARSGRTSSSGIIRVETCPGLFWRALLPWRERRRPMDITLPEALESIVRRRVEEGGYASTEEYVRDLILSDSEPSPEWQRLTDQERMAVEQIDQELLKCARLRATDGGRRCLLGELEATSPRADRKWVLTLSFSPRRTGTFLRRPHTTTGKARRRRRTAGSTRSRRRSGFWCRTLGSAPRGRHAATNGSLA